MLTIENVLVSETLVENTFVCDLVKCKGDCCVQGVSGAPLEPSELDTLKAIYPVVAPFLSEEGRMAIATDGVYVTDKDGDLTTPCVDTDKQCAYAIFENGIAQCGIEKAYLAGLIEFRKPISCHLYPIRVTTYPEFDALNYDRWSICSPACALGEALQVKVYAFLKEPLERKYGIEWYATLVRQARLTL